MFKDTNFEGVDTIKKLNVHIPFDKRILRNQTKISEFETAVFSGGLTKLQLLGIKHDLSKHMEEEKLEKLIERLKEHIGLETSNQPPLGTIEGSYTKEQAHMWNKSHKDIMESLLVLTAKEAKPPENPVKIATDADSYITHYICSFKKHPVF